jgi:hypothetical protein
MLISLLDQYCACHRLKIKKSLCHTCKSWTLMKTDEEKIYLKGRSMAQAVSTGYEQLNTMMNCIIYTKSLA